MEEHNLIVVGDIHLQESQPKKNQCLDILNWIFDSDFNNEIVVNFNPLLMVKDFNQNSDLKIDNTFMTNADVPYIATRNIIDNAKNPFTGKILSTVDKLDGVEVYMTYNYWNTSHFTTNRVILDKEPTIKHVHDDIFNESNWTKVDYKPNN